MNKKTKSGIFLFLAPMIWGVAFVAQCMVDTNKLGTLTFNAVRYLLGAICLVPVVLLLEKESLRDAKILKKTVLYGTITGAVLFVASEFQMYGISINKSSGKSGFLTGLYMVIVPFLSFVIYGKKVLLREWIAAIVATFGLFLLSVTDGFGSINLGDVMVFICAFFWAMHILVIDRFSDKVPPIAFSCVQFAACAVFSGIFAMFTEKFSISGIYINLLPILYTGIFSTGIAYTFQVLGQRDANPNFASIVLASEGVYAALSGAIFLGEKLAVRGYVGCALMLIGTILSQLKIKRRIVGKKA